MSPPLTRPSLNDVSFPRVSGDEPTLRVDELPDEGFSPRERG